MIAFLSLLFIPILKAQNDPSETHTSVKSLFQYAESVYGPNDLLVNGVAYKPDHIQAESHPYFLSEEWQRGMVISNGRAFKEVDLKYNIVSDELVLRAAIKTGAISFIVLNPKLVDAFEIGGHFFVNLPKQHQIESPAPFLELVYEGRQLFLIMHKKLFSAHYTERTPSGIFSKEKKTSYIFDNQQLYKVNNRRSLLKYFKSIKPALRKYMRKNRIRYHKADPHQLNQLMKFCEDEKAIL